MDYNDIPIIEFRKQNKNMEISLYPLQGFLDLYELQDCPVYRLGFYGILFIKKGEGELSVYWEPYSYKPGAFVFLHEGLVLSSECLNQEGWILQCTSLSLEKFFIASERFIFRMVFHYFKSFFLQFEKLEKDRIIKLFQSIEDEMCSTKDALREEMISSLMHQILIMAERKQHDVKDNKHHWWPGYTDYLKFLDKVDEHHNHSRKAKDYAEMLNITPKTLNKYCKLAMNCTPKYYLDWWIILEIKRSLIGTDGTLKEIAHQLGFSESTNLVKFFKQKTGHTPKEYKKMIGKPIK